ncbi:PR-1-like protein [Dendrothele bispora CBS 962.96]|uniref:PR-1-like protein n=1 Tax=Dendrothele bispora (strain CBS 962.96) TaxID=1314807 RepID=A0A4V4HG63_DENBC|nr:PR-1-like protein [Dendrothele bispora CBS 962.96]
MVSFRSAFTTVLSFALTVGVYPASIKPLVPQRRATEDEKAQFLQIHNDLRAQHGADPLTWNDTLADAAQTWADRCVFEHSGGQLGPYGENLAAGAGGGYDLESAMNSWSVEASDYQASNPQPSHFTQMVWKDSTQLGCAVHSPCSDIFPGFDNALYYVCEYYPQGNVIGRFDDNVQA